MSLSWNNIKDESWDLFRSPYGDRESAIPYLEQQLMATTDAIIAHGIKIQLMFFLNRLGRCDEAIAWGKDILSTAPDDVPAMRSLYIAYLDSHKIAEAETLRNRILELDPREERFLRNVASDFRKERNIFTDRLYVRDYSGAVDALIGMYNNLHISGGQIDLLMGDVTSLHKQPGDAPPMHFVLAALRHRRKESGVPVLCLLGYFYKSTKNYLEAGEVLEEALKIEPDNLTVLYGLYAIYAKNFSPKNDRALEIAERLCELDPDNKHFALMLAAQHVRDDEYRSAVRLLAPIYKDGRADRNILQVLGTAYMRQQLYDDADVIFQTLADQGGTKKHLMISAFMKKDYVRAHGLAMQILQDKFDVKTMAIAIVADSGKVDQYEALCKQMGIKKIVIQDVLRDVRKLQVARATFLKDMSIEMFSIPVSTVYDMGSPIRHSHRPVRAPQLANG